VDFDRLCKVCLVVSIVGIILGYSSNVIFWFSTRNPQVIGIETVSIDTTQDPIQTDPVNKNPIHIGHINLLPQADYNISGMVVAKNIFVPGLFSFDSFGRLAPVDLGIVWGKLVDPDFEKYITFKSYKTIDRARILASHPKFDYPFDYGYLSSHISHNHIIPANNNVLKALISVKKKDIVNLQGYLVDIIINNRPVAKTSLSRTDENSYARGGGACEIMYVKRVRIGNKVYQ